MNPVQEIDFLGVTINSLKRRLSLPKEKVLKIQESVSRYSCQRSNDSSRTNKIVRSSCFNNSGSFGSSDEFSISSAATNKSNFLV